ncbi:MAG: hypothetical protein ACP5SI_04395, partial [Chloroflexia bacterium]
MEPSAKPCQPHEAGDSGPATSLASNIHVQTLASFLGGIYRGALAPVWQPFVLSLGASMRLLGLLESLGGWSGIV